VPAVSAGISSDRVRTGWAGASLDRTAGWARGVERGKAAQPLSRRQRTQPMKVRGKWHSYTAFGRGATGDVRIMRRISFFLEESSAPNRPSRCTRAAAPLQARIGGGINRTMGLLLAPPTMNLCGSPAVLEV
jgi:hypothetical protein